MVFTTLGEHLGLNEEPNVYHIVGFLRYGAISCRLLHAFRADLSHRKLANRSQV